MFLLLSEFTSEDGVQLIEQMLNFMSPLLPITAVLFFIVIGARIIGDIGHSNSYNRTTSMDMLPKIEVQVLKQLPEWTFFEKVNINLRKSLKNWDKKTLVAQCPEIQDIIDFNYKTYKESTTYLNEFGVSKEVSLIFLQNGELLQRIVQDLEKQPEGKSKVLMQLHIKMAKELTKISRQLEDEMQNHMKTLNEHYLHEEKLLKQDYQKIIQSRTLIDLSNKTDYDPFYKEDR